MTTITAPTDPAHIQALLNERLNAQRAVHQDVTLLSLKLIATDLLARCPQAHHLVLIFNDEVDGYMWCTVVLDETGAELLDTADDDPNDIQQLAANLEIDDLAWQAFCDTNDEEGDALLRLADCLAIDINEIRSNVLAGSHDSTVFQQACAAYEQIITAEVLATFPAATGWLTGVSEWDNGYFFDGSLDVSFNDGVPVEGITLSDSANEALTELSGLTGPLGAHATYSVDIATGTAQRP
jgi:hypothetical protein